MGYINLLIVRDIFGVLLEHTQGILGYTQDIIEVYLGYTLGYFPEYTQGFTQGCTPGYTWGILKVYSGYTRALLGLFWGYTWDILTGSNVTILYIFFVFE